MDITYMTRGKLTLTLTFMAATVLLALPLAAPAEVTASPETLRRKM